jgi:hypothetical protein
VKYADVSEEHAAITFSVEERAKQDASRSSHHFSNVNICGAGFSETSVKCYEATRSHIPVWHAATVSRIMMYGHYSCLSSSGISGCINLIAK